MGMERLDPPLRCPRWEIAAVVMATLAGLCLRLYRLGDTPLLSLEVYTWDFSKQTISFILGPLAHIETNPPLYYLLMHLVTRLGDTELILRLPSALSGTLAIPLVYLLGRLGRVPSSGVIGAALLALSAVNISYSREARAHSLAQVFCLLAAIGAVVLINAYMTREPGKGVRQEAAGWIIFTLSSIVGFYLHYTFAFVIIALEFAIVVVWFLRPRLDKTFLLGWAFSCLLLFVGMSWGLELARNQAHSENIAWIEVPSPWEAASLLFQMDGYTVLYRLQPWSSWILIATACLGLIAGWKRSAAILVSGSLFALFPVLLFGVSQVRPMFIERVLVPPSFSVYLLAGFGCLFLLRKGVQYAAALSKLQMKFTRHAFVERGRLVPLAAAVLLVPAAISARNSLREAPILEPYDRVADYLAATLTPGDAAAGTDGVIYYRRKTHASFPYFKLVNGDFAEAQITYGSPTVQIGDVTNLANVHNAVYVVLREKLQNSADTRARLGLKEPPIASFDSIGVYRLAGACPFSAPCTTKILDEIRKRSSTECCSASAYADN